MKGFPKPSNNEDNNEFHMWVGYCIVAWSKVEDRLFELCWKSLDCRAELAAIVYFRTPNLDSRLSLTDELVKAVLPTRERASGGHDHPSVKVWNAILSDIRGLLSVRRRLAHQPVQQRIYGWAAEETDVHGETVFTHTGTGTLHYTHVSDAEALRGKGAEGPLYRSDLLSHHVELDNLTERLGRFYQDQLLPRLVERQAPSLPSHTD